MLIQADAHAFHLTGPLRLVAETRGEFRTVALAALEQASRRGARDFVLELAHTVAIDASGLGILVLIEKRARERGMRTVLQQPAAELRHLLDITRLDYLFRIVT